MHDARPLNMAVVSLRPDWRAMQAFAQENGLFFFETSAKSNMNVVELFNEIAQRLPKAAPKDAPATSSGIALAEEPQPAAKRGACCS